MNALGIENRLGHLGPRPAPLRGDFAGPGERGLHLDAGVNAQQNAGQNNQQVHRIKNIMDITSSVSVAFRRRQSADVRATPFCASRSRCKIVNRAYYGTLRL